MRLYISGPMSGTPDLGQFWFNNAFFRLRRCNYQVLSPADWMRADMTYRQLLTTDVNLIGIAADGIALLHGWRESKGAKAEVEFARAIELPIHMVRCWERTDPIETGGDCDGGCVVGVDAELQRTIGA